VLKSVFRVQVKHSLSSAQQCIIPLRDTSRQDLILTQKDIVVIAFEDK
jgi:hypothetical protein